MSINPSVVNLIIFRAATFLNIIFIVFVVFFERKEPARRMAWLFALVFLPVIGMIIYILFSGHFFTRNRKMETARRTVMDALQPYMNDQLDRLRNQPDKIPHPEVKKYAHLVSMNLVYGTSLLTYTENLKIFCWGQEKFESLCVDMEAATESIHMLYFIFRNDATGRRLLEILCRKAKQGIAVKLMYDDLGSIKTPESFFAPLKTAGGSVLPFFRLRFRLPFSLNFRNHRKIVVIDGKIGYMGGINVGDEYANCSRRKNPVLWRDTHIRMTGSSVQYLQLIFLIDWYAISGRITQIKSAEDVGKFFPLADFKNIGKRISEGSTMQLFGDLFQPKHIPTQIVSSGPDDIRKSEIRDGMIRMIMSAQSFIYIQTPYFTPDEAFLTILKIAAFSGIDVRIMVPGKWDKFYVKAATHEYMRELSGIGIRFFAYPGFIHSKTVVVDGRTATIGSANIDSRSFDLCFEANAFFYDRNTAGKCAKIFLEDQKVCTELHKKWFDSRFILIRAWWGFCKLFSPLM
jgi:cardiolipin synthase